MNLRIATLPLFLVFWLALPPSSFALEDEPRHVLLRDDTAGYVIPLPQGWAEVTDERHTQELACRVCAVFTRDGSIPGASHIRAAEMPDGGKAAPAMIAFVLSYQSLGLGSDMVQEIAKSPLRVSASLANALQEAYMQHFPQSIMLNHHLGDEFFSLNLRSVLDFDDEENTTRNQHLRVTLTAGGALVLMTLYEGLPDSALDTEMSASVRNLRLLQGKELQSVKPPYVASFLDYLLLFGAIMFVLYLVRRVRGRK